MKLMQWSLLCSFVFMAGCATKHPATLTPLEIESLQTKEYDSGKKIVFDSVISVFQDLGYTLKSADEDTGFITAESPADSSFASKFLFGISDVSQTEATAFVERAGNTTKLRLNFVKTSKTSSFDGQTDREDVPILDARIYQNAFERIGNAIFVRQGVKPSSMKKQSN